MGPVDLGYSRVDMIFDRLVFKIAAVAGAVAMVAALGRPADAQVGITINGSNVDVSPAPILDAGRVFVPLRGVFENLGASVVYANGQIDATGNGRDISLHIGSTQATVNGQSETIDVAPFIVGASTYVPLRFVSQALGASVAWDEQDQVVGITLAGADTSYQAAPPSQDYADDTDWVDAPPPPIPAYEPPPVPEPNDIWMPGYWAWGSGGYYWVPGVWTPAPDPGYLWTPGYWAWSNNSYGWHQGYWADRVGYYGGINYGAGYYGHGYAGGRWSGDQFAYNTAVTRVVNRTIIRNVYIDRTVIVNNTTTVNRISYNGGRGGIAVRPTASELAAQRVPHRSMTLVQEQHVQVAAQDRRQLATVNAGRPPIVVAPHPFTPAAKPAGFVAVTAHDATVAQKYIVRSSGAPAPAPHYATPRDTVPRFAPNAARATSPVHAATPAASAPHAPAEPRPAYARPAEPSAAHVAPHAVIVPPPAEPHTAIAPPVRPAYARPAPTAPPIVHHAPPIPAPAAPAAYAAPARTRFTAPVSRPAQPQRAVQPLAPPRPAVQQVAPPRPAVQHVPPQGQAPHGRPDADRSHDPH
jgi:hypothetical protein